MDSVILQLLFISWIVNSLNIVLAVVAGSAGVGMLVWIVYRYMKAQHDKA